MTTDIALYANYYVQTDIACNNRHRFTRANRHRFVHQSVQTDIALHAFAASDEDRKMLSPLE